MKKAKLCFISSPYASIKSKNRDKIARNLAINACKIVKAKGYEPLSPVLAFLGVYDESEREKIMQSCKELIRVCKYYYFFECEYSAKSKGMQEEKEYAKRFSKEIK